MKKLALIFLMFYFLGCLVGCEGLDDTGMVTGTDGKTEAVINYGKTYITVDIDNYELNEETGIIKIYRKDEVIITSIDNVIICEEN